ncbi:ATP-binding protein [Actinoplanes flavus]|uniref:ATP-binding protein n=1 Tax=Actinoplanes flavus TaxID=2820290 RepID=A0ABS3UWB7_9ACTN|nr:ATP-binding protein [Actinoplanes flavus]MBO3742859.1 ATP-binding protein [Actinoplanes flavus]
MPSQLVCRPEQDLPVAVLSVRGTLDRITGGALGTAIRRSLAVQPSRMVLDVTRLRVGDPLALSALGKVVCQAEEFPAVPIVVCGADPATRAALAAEPGCATLEMADGPPESVAGARAEPDPPAVRARLRPVPEACRQVRHLVTQACAGWQRSEVTATAALVATELVANVVRHAHTSMDFTLRLRGGRLIVAVRDRSRRMPRTLDPAVTDSGGRGLRLIRDLTETWGVLPVVDGKVVWSRLAAGAAV